MCVLDVETVYNNHDLNLGKMLIFFIITKRKKLKDHFQILFIIFIHEYFVCYAYERDIESVK